MFCPKCGTPNIEDARYCRACGADISLVPQALTRSLPDAAQAALEKPEEKKKKEKAKEPTLERGLGNIFEGIAHLIIVILGFVYFTGAFFLWIWFIIPALSNIGKGIGQIISANRNARALPPHAPFQHDSLIAPPAAAGALPSRETAEIDEHPFSVTEGTTRHLDTSGAAKQ